MTDVIQDRAGVPVLMCDPSGPPVATAQDALDLVGAALLGARVVAVPVSRLDERFFSLGTRLAGEIMQKFANYHVRLAVIGDISGHLAASSALRALIHESNHSATSGSSPTSTHSTPVWKPSPERPTVAQRDDVLSVGGPRIC